MPEQPLLPGLPEKSDAPLKPYNNERTMSKKTEPISLDDSVLLTGFSEAEVEFINDNEDAIHKLISNMTKTETCIITLDVQKKTIFAANTTTREVF